MSTRVNHFIYDAPSLAFPFLALPEEVMIHVINQSRKEERAALRLACKKIRNLVDSPWVWKDRGISIRCCKHSSSHDPWKMLERRKITNVWLDDVSFYIKDRFLHILLQRCPKLKHLIIPSDIARSILRQLKDKNMRLASLGIVAIDFPHMRDLELMPTLSELTTLELKFVNYNCLKDLLEACLQMKTLEKLCLSLPMNLIEVDEDIITSINRVIYGLPRLRHLAINTPIRNDFNPLVRSICSDDKHKSINLKSLELGCFYGELPDDLHSMFHSIRWPVLTSIKLMLRLEDDTQTSLREFLHSAQSNCKNLTRLVINFDLVMSLWNGDIEGIRKKNLKWLPEIPQSIKYLTLCHNSTSEGYHLPAYYVVPVLSEALRKNLIWLELYDIRVDVPELELIADQFTALRRLKCSVIRTVTEHHLRCFHEQCKCRLYTIPT